MAVLIRNPQKRWVETSSRAGKSAAQIKLRHQDDFRGVFTGPLLLFAAVRLLRRASPFLCIARQGR